jgi:hypothetical protein
LQFENDLIDFLHRSAGHAPELQIQIFGDWLTGRVTSAAFPARERSFTSDELTKFTLERIRRRLIDIIRFFRCTPVRRSVLLRA